MSDIEQVYSKAPSQDALEADLLEQGLAEEDGEGNVQPSISVTTWTPLKSVTREDGEIVDRTFADFLLVLTGWTFPSLIKALNIDVDDLDEETEEMLKNGSTDDVLDFVIGSDRVLAHGTEIGVDVSALNLHPSEPKLTTYGA